MKYRYYVTLSPTISLKYDVTLSDIMRWVHDPTLTEEENREKARHYLESKGAIPFSDLSFNDFQDGIAKDTPIASFNVKDKLKDYKQTLERLSQLIDAGQEVTEDDKNSFKDDTCLVFESAALISSRLGMRLTDICDKKEQ